LQYKDPTVDRDFDSCYNTHIDNKGADMFNSYARIRPETTRLIDMMDSGEIDARAVADMALSWLSESDVKGMMQVNDIPTTDQAEEDEEEPEEEWTPDNADFNDPGSRHHY
jgi:hypothetical protein